MAIQKYQNIVVAGVNGTLGTFVVAALVKAEFTVTILTTNAEKTAAVVPEASHTKIVQVDYVKEDLVPILRGQDAVVCLISRMVSKPHIVLADAAVEADVPRIIPSSFGIKMEEELRTNKALVDKWKTLDHVGSLVEAGKITSTAVQTSAFLDWALERGILLNIHGPTVLMNGGDVPLSTTHRGDIAQAIVGILQNPEATTNKVVAIQSLHTTQNRLLTLAQEVDPEREFKIIPVQTEALEKQAKENWDCGERSAPALAGFLAHASYGQGKAAWSEDDNELLGVQRWSDQKIKDFLKDLMQREPIARYPGNIAASSEAASRNS
ncbi:uncharacterized protein AB675_4237 [Cyphellophora attinorum]|uniref:NAD(P)-binding domain-containing protein n=1 Tax=Cyphellophora attinorum TaxID=1664694 RepID=A0A0N0NL10_9EURO|nr:uncharacterized protein AB675_4237 [Phialophora attinorum]KPI38489.1 hypothetical protein AB675_4237 [Phialophora attinorum]